VQGDDIKGLVSKDLDFKSTGDKRITSADVTLDIAHLLSPTNLSKSQQILTPN